jgi:hypothetical protein
MVGKQVLDCAAFAAPVEMTTLQNERGRLRITRGLTPDEDACPVTRGGATVATHCFGLPSLRHAPATKAAMKRLLQAERIHGGNDAEENDAEENDAEDVICRLPQPPTRMERAQMGRPEQGAPAFSITVATSDQNS